MFRYLVVASAVLVLVLSATEQDLLAVLEPQGKLPLTRVRWLPCNAMGMEEMPCLLVLGGGLSGLSKIPSHLLFPF